MTLSGFINRWAALATALAVGAALLTVFMVMRGGPPSAVAADHLDAPGLAPPGGDRRLDINDLYAFKSRPGYTTLIMTVNPLAEAGKQERFARSVPGIRKNKRASYHFKIDNDGDNRREVDFKVTFGAPNAKGVQRVTLRRNGRVIAVGRTSEFGKKRIVKGRKGTKLFAGMADDPFFFDLPGFQNLTAPLDADPTNDSDSFLGCLAPRPDTFAGSNVSVIAIEGTDCLERVVRGPMRSICLRADEHGVDRWPTEPLRKNRYKPRQSGQRSSQLQGRDRGHEVRRRPHTDALLSAPESLRPVPISSSSLTLQTLWSLNDVGGPVGGADDPSDDAAGIDDLANFLVPDLLTIDLAQASGFPNGRRLQDDVIDGELDLITEGLFDTDCVSAYDVTFRAKFPYVAGPHA